MLRRLALEISPIWPSYPTITFYLVASMEPPIDDNEVAVVLPETGALALLEHDGQAAQDYARESLAPATRRAYQTDVDAFIGWCRERGVEALPAEPEAVAAFLAHEAGRGLRASTIARRASAATGPPPPTTLG